MKDTLENRKLIKTFRLFVSQWLKTGFDWYNHDPKLLSGWRFGHDWNNDFSNKQNKGELPPVPLKLKDSISETVCALIASGKLSNNLVKEIAEWLESGVTIPNPLTRWDEPFLKHMIWCLFHQLEQVEDLIEK